MDNKKEYDRVLQLYLKGKATEEQKDYLLKHTLLDINNILISLERYKIR